MLKAASLFYATVIALVISILSGSLLLFSYFNQQEKEMYSREEKVCRNAISGIHLLMAQDSLISPKKLIDLFGDGTDSVSLQTFNWGAFKLASCIAFSGKNKNSKAAMIGVLPDSNLKSSIYLTDNGKPLTLCGKTNIRGVCYLPQAGIKRGYIEGKSFVGNELISGTIKKSDKMLPALSKNILQWIHKIYSIASRSADSVIYCHSVLSKDSLSNSFFNKTLQLYSHGIITVEPNMYASGNIKIVSDTMVKIKAGCTMHDVIIIAPMVIMDERFNGEIQVFATDSIGIGKHCSLNYPSVLVISEQKVRVKNSTVSIDEKSNLAGNILAYNEMPATHQQILVSISKEDTVRGMIYTNGDVDVKGVVYGNIMCNQFFLKTTSSEYEGYIMDATVDITKLSKYFVSANLITSKNKSIAKWVN